MLACIGDEQTRATLEFDARSTIGASCLAERLSIAILDCGGWILEQSETHDGLLRVQLEFECERAMEVYGVLVGLGIQLSREAHLGLTRLWQCARHGHCLKRLPVTRIHITILTV